MKFWIKGALVFIPALVLLGCSTSGDVQNEAGADGMAPSASTSTSGASTSGVGASKSASGEQMNGQMQADSAMQDSRSRVSNEDFFKRDAETKALLEKRTVYFDFDKSEIKREFQAILEAHADNLADNPTASVTLEGHCDERGTREYNIALGERRAKAVQRVLTLRGASPTQIRIVSYGEERPAAAGHNEDAWSLNRRAEIVYN